MQSLTRVDWVAWLLLDYPEWPWANTHPPSTSSNQSGFAMPQAVTNPPGQFEQHRITFSGVVGNSAALPAAAAIRQASNRPSSKYFQVSNDFC